MENRLAPKKTAAPEVVRAKKGKTIVRGYAAKFDVLYSLGEFDECVGRGAFNNADMTDIVCLFNHNPDEILGRTTGGTLKVGVDSIGLFYEVVLPNSPRGENMRVALERSDVTQSSWAFTLGSDLNKWGDKWTRHPTGRPIRTLTHVKKIYDVSPVTTPANPDTSSYISSDTTERSYQAFLSTESGSSDEAERKKAEDDIQFERSAKGLEASLERAKTEAGHVVYTDDEFEEIAQDIALKLAIAQEQHERQRRLAVKSWAEAELNIKAHEAMEHKPLR